MILTTYPAAPTIPSIQKIRHGAGVAGYTHRYIGDDVSATVGAVATSFPDYIGATHLTGTNGPTVRALADGRKYLEFDGVNDTLKATNITTGTVKTVVAVARARATDSGYTILLGGQGVGITRAGTSGTAINPGTQVVNPTKLDNQWRVVVATASATAASIIIDGVKTTATPAGIWGTSLTVGANGSPASWSMLDIVELVTYDTDLTDPQAASVRAAMIAAYPTLLS